MMTVRKNTCFSLFKNKFHTWSQEVIIKFPFMLWLHQKGNFTIDSELTCTGDYSKDNSKKPLLYPKFKGFFFLMINTWKQPFRFILLKNLSGLSQSHQHITLRITRVVKFHPNMIWNCRKHDMPGSFQVITVLYMSRKISVHGRRINILTLFTKHGLLDMIFKTQVIKARNI